MLPIPIYHAILAVYYNDNNNIMQTIGVFLTRLEFNNIQQRRRQTDHVPVPGSYDAYFRLDFIDSGHKPVGPIGSCDDIDGRSPVISFCTRTPDFDTLTYTLNLLTLQKPINKRPDGRH